MKRVREMKEKKLMNFQPRFYELYIYSCLFVLVFMYVFRR